MNKPKEKPLPSSEPSKPPDLPSDPDSGWALDEQWPDESPDGFDPPDE
jgi:hypothetical protein